jgi:hypothetical protein
MEQGHADAADLGAGVESEIAFSFGLGELFENRRIAFYSRHSSSFGADLTRDREAPVRRDPTGKATREAE